MQGWEFSEFTPVDSTETWWLSGNLKPIYPYEEGYHPHGVHLFISVEGQPVRLAIMVTSRPTFLASCASRA